MVGMGQFTPVERVLRLASQLMAGKSFSVGEVADFLAVHRSNVKKYLDSIHEHLVPLQSRRVGPRIEWHAAAAREQDGMVRAMAALLGMPMLELLGEDDVAPAGVEVLRREVAGWPARLPAAGEGAHQPGRPAVRGWPWATPGSRPTLLKLVRAIACGHGVEFDYVRSNGEKRRYAEVPLQLLFYGDSPYVVVANDDRGGIAARAVHRLTWKKLRTDLSLEDREAYANLLSLRLKECWGIFLGDDYPLTQVRLRARGAYKVFLAHHPVHPSHQIIDAEAGIHQLQVRICPEFRAWLVGLLPQVDILEPRQLRQELIRELSTTVKALEEQQRRSEALPRMAAESSPDFAVPPGVV